MSLPLPMGRPEVTGSCRTGSGIQGNTVLHLLQG